MRRIALLRNPTMTGSRAARLTAAVVSRLRAQAEVHVFCGESVAESAALLRAARAHCDAVAVLGGDGLAHLALQEVAGTDIPLGIIPAGTGNDLAESLGVPRDPLAAADALLHALGTGDAPCVDLGRTDSGRWWATILCAGFDSAVNERANRMRWPRGPRRYDVAIAVEVMRLRPRAFTLHLDDTSLSLPATLIAIGNAPQYGGGKVIAPAAGMADGCFAVTVVGAVNRRTLVRVAPKLPHAGHIGHPSVSTFEACTVTLSATGTVAYADGERIGPLPVSTTCVPGALRVLLPRDLAKPGRPE